MTAIAFSMVVTLPISASCVMPVPRPVTRAAASPLRTLITADAAVVLPMPTSPVQMMSRPFSSSSSTRRMPLSMARTASSRVMAGPCAMLAVPMRILSWRMSASLRSALTPRSVTMTRAPTCRPMTLMPAPPCTMLTTMAGVTSAGNALTPSATTPWSAAMTAMAFCSMTGCSLPWMPASWMESVSSRPSALGGLVSWSCRASAARMASASRGPMAAMVRSSRSLTVAPLGHGRDPRAGRRTGL